MRPKLQPGRGRVVITREKGREAAALSDFAVNDFLAMGMRHGGAFFRPEKYCESFSQSSGSHRSKTVARYCGRRFAFSAFSTVLVSCEVVGDGGAAPAELFIP